MLTSPIGPTKQSRSFGFTLLELMIVLLIFSVFSTLGILRLDGVFSGGDLRLACRMIVNEINRLRGQAIYMRKPQILFFSMDRNAFYSRAEEPGQREAFEGAVEKAENEQIFPTGIELEDVVILSQGKFQEGEASIRFYPNGCIDETLIHVRNADQDVYTLEINPMTGQVSLHDRYIDQKIGP